MKIRRYLQACFGCLLFMLHSPNALSENSAELLLLLEATEAFQQNVLNLEADILRLEQDQQAAAVGRIDIYLSTALEPRLALQSLQLTIDGSVIADHRYNAAQRNAFRKGGAHTVAAIALPVGEHQLAATFSIRDGDRELHGSKQLHFNNTPDGIWLELLIEDVPGEIYASQPYSNQPLPRRIELSVQTWEPAP